MRGTRGARGCGQRRAAAAAGTDEAESDSGSSQLQPKGANLLYPIRSWHEEGEREAGGSGNGFEII